MKSFKGMQSKRSVLTLAILAAFNATAEEGVKAEGEDLLLEEVHVFGKFQQSMVDRIPVAPAELPFTLNVVDRAFIDARNFTRPIEALTTLPNIVRTEDRQGTGGTQFQSRGFEAPILVDNRRQNSFRGAGSRDDSFVDSYEVLKGPASIVSGPVGAGGIINTITKSPHADSATEFKLRTDQFGSAGVEFDTNIGEIDGSDTVLVRVSGAYRDFNYDADEVSRETTAVRPVAVFNLSESTSAKASVAYTKSDINPASGFPLLQSGEIPDGIDTDTFAGYSDSESELEDTLVDLEINHEFLDSLKLTVRGSQQKTDFDYQNTSGLYNYSGSDAGLDFMFGFPNTAETESEVNFADAQLAYTADFWGNEQNFVIGTAYDKRSFERLFNSYSYDGPYSLADIDQPRYGGGGFGEPEPFTLDDQKLDSYFAEAALRPTDALTIVAGVRYDQLDQVTVNYRRGNEYKSEFDDSEFTWRLGGSFEVADSLNLYASYAEAFVPQFGVRRDNGALPAETSEGFEVGVKGSVFNDVLTFQAGLFDTLRKDVSLRDPNNTPTEAFVVSAGEVRVQGVEFTSNLNPTAGFNVALNLGYTDVDVTEAGADEISEPVFPELTGSLYLDYEIQSGALEGLSIGGGLRYVGEREGPRTDWDSYSIADLNLGYAITEQVDVSLDILNLTDEKYVENTSMNAVNKLAGGAVLGAPRTAALSLNWKL